MTVTTNEPISMSAVINALTGAEGLMSQAALVECNLSIALQDIMEGLQKVADNMEKTAFSAKDINAVMGYVNALFMVIPAMGAATLAKIKLKIPAEQPEWMTKIQESKVVQNHMALRVPAKMLAKASTAMSHYAGPGMTELFGRVGSLLCAARAAFELIKSRNTSVIAADQAGVDSYKSMEEATTKSVDAATTEMNRLAQDLHQIEQNWASVIRYENKA